MTWGVSGLSNKFADQDFWRGRREARLRRGVAAEMPVNG